MSRLPLAEPADVRAWIRRAVRRNARQVGWMLALFAVATVLGLVGPRLLGALVEEVRAGGPVRVDLFVGAFLVVLVASSTLLRFGHARARVVGEWLLADVREEFVGRSLSLPVSTVESVGTGDLLSRATSDVDRIEFAVRNAAPEILTALITLILTATAMLVTSPLLSLGALVAVPLIALSTRWYRRRAPEVLEGLLARWGEVQASSNETVTGAYTVEALGLQRRRARQHEVLLRGAADAEFAHRGLLARWLPCLQMSYVLPVAAILLLGGWAYGRGLVGLGEVTAVVLYAQALSGPLDDLLIWVDELQVGNVGLRRILGVHRAAMDSPDPAAGSRPASGASSAQGLGHAQGNGRARGAAHDVELSGVRFGYVRGREVLHGIDLRVPEGEHLAIVGPSGSGKSTLARVMAGMSRPGAGAMTIGGVDVTGWPAERLRAEVLLLTQEHYVFSASVRDNLAFAGTSWCDDSLLRALDVVGAGEWVRDLPDGLDTQLGAGAHPVPPAVAQQLALARVVLADPPVVVLDEATSLLGTGVRAAEQSLRSVLAGRTVVSIAHRLDVARIADRILVLDDGAIAEEGTHDELLVTGGSYASLVRTTAGNADGATRDDHHIRHLSLVVPGSFRG